MRRKRQRGDEGGDGGDAVVAVGTPGVLDRLEIDEAYHRHDDHRGQYRLRQVVEQRRQEQQRQQDEETGEHGRHAGHGAGIDIDRRARERTGNGKRLAEAAGDIGESLADQLLVRVDLLLGLGGDGLGDGNRLHETDQRDDDGGREQAAEHAPGNLRRADRRQALGHFADHLAAAGQYERAAAGLRDAPELAVGAFSGRHFAVREEAIGSTVRAVYAFEHHAANGPVAAAVFVFTILELQLEQLDLVAGCHRLVGKFNAAFLHGLQFRRLGADLVGDFLDSSFGACELGQQRPCLGLGDMRDAGGRVALEAYGPGHHRGQCHGDQYSRQSWRPAANSPYDGDGRYPHRQGRHMRIANLLQHAPDVLDEMLGATHRHADQLIHLRQADDYGRGIGKTDDHRMREKVDDHTELESAERQLHQAHHQRQHDRQGNELLGAHRRQWRQARCRQQRDHRHRPAAELVRRSPQRGHHHRQEGRVEAIVGRHAGELSVGHRLRHQHQRHGQAGDEVRAQERA